MAEPKFRMGDVVRKKSGSQWHGTVCGTYSTTLTPEGYAVESSAHSGSVQIYPAAALELVLPTSGVEASGERRQWQCFLCKSLREGHHGTLDDKVTPCPNGVASTRGGER